VQEPLATLGRSDCSRIRDGFCRAARRSIRACVDYHTRRSRAIREDCFTDPVSMTTKTNSLRSRLVWLAVAFALIFGTRFLSTGQTGATTPAILFNGWGLSPVGNPIELPGDMPARIVPTADSRFLIVNSVGFNEHGVFVIDLAKASVVQQVDLAKSWIGLGLAADGRLLIASGGGPMPPEPTYWGVRLGIPPAAR